MHEHILKVLNVDPNTMEVVIPNVSSGSLQVTASNPSGDSYGLDNAFVLQKEMAKKTVRGSSAGVLRVEVPLEFFVQMLRKRRVSANEASLGRAS